MSGSSFTANTNLTRGRHEEELSMLNRSDFIRYHQLKQRIKDGEFLSREDFLLVKRIDTLKNLRSNRIAAKGRWRRTDNVVGGYRTNPR